MTNRLDFLEMSLIARGAAKALGIVTELELYQNALTVVIDATENMIEALGLRFSRVVTLEITRPLLPVRCRTARDEAEAPDSSSQRCPEGAKRHEPLDAGDEAWGGQVILCGRHAWVGDSWCGDDHVFTSEL